MFILRELNKLKNTELVKRCANDTKNKQVWLEFVSRFDKHIYLIVLRECKIRGLYKNKVQFKEAVQDLVQDIYLKILKDDCQSLKAFRGNSENSIYIYLGTIAKNAVINYIIRMNAQKRPQIEKYLDDFITTNDEGGEIFYKDVLKSTIFDTEQELTLIITKEDIEVNLNNILKGKYKERNKLICKLHFYDGFSVNEIASYFNFGLSAARIANIISEIKQNLIKGLKLEKKYENITC